MALVVGLDPLLATSPAAVDLGTAFVLGLINLVGQLGQLLQLVSRGVPVGTSKAPRVCTVFSRVRSGESGR